MLGCLRIWERGREWRRGESQRAYPEDLDFAFDFGHAEGTVNVSPANEFDGDLLAP